MGFVEAITAAAPAISALTGVANTGISIGNMGMQAHYNNLNRDLMYQSWAREDNAIQRRVKDLLAAGLHPALAAGAGASSSPPIELNSPQMDRIEDIGSKVAATLQQQQQYHLTRAQAELTNAEAEKTKQEIAYNTEANPLRLRIQTAEANLSEQSLVHRVEQLKAGNRLTNAQAELTRLQQTLTSINTDRARTQHLLDQGELYIQELQRTLMDKYALRNAEAESLAAQLANEAAQLAIDKSRVEYDNAKWNGQYYRDIGRPIGAQDGFIVQQWRAVLDTITAGRRFRRMYTE